MKDLSQLNYSSTPINEEKQTSKNDFNKTQPVTRQEIEPEQRAEGRQQNSFVPAQRIQIIQETSQTRQPTTAAGFNVSYDNSFSAIKTNIFNFKGGVTNNQGATLQDNVSVEEKPNKPRGENEKHLSLNQTHELNLFNITTSVHDDMFNKTA